MLWEHEVGGSNPPAPTVLVKACLNGGRSREEHPAVPVTPEEIALDARRSVDAGAGAVHVHPRDAAGRETLDARFCDAVVAALREACPGVPVGLTTGLWIAGDDTAARLAAVRGWSELPDFASVNVSEPGTVELAETLLELGIGVEAGLATVEEARWLAESDLASRCLRVLVEVEEDEPDGAVARAAAIDVELDRAGIDMPRLHHGFGPATWAVLRAGAAAGRDLRVGLEDTLVHADGRPAADNAGLVADAVGPAFGGIPLR